MPKNYEQSLMFRVHFKLIAVILTPLNFRSSRVWHFRGRVPNFNHSEAEPQRTVFSFCLVKLCGLSPKIPYSKLGEPIHYPSRLKFSALHGVYFWIEKIISTHRYESDCSFYHRKLLGGPFCRSLNVYYNNHLINSTHKDTNILLGQFLLPN